MGYEDRDYYRDEARGFGGGSFNNRSMVFTLILINVAVFFLDMFTGEVEGSKTQWLSYFLAIKTTALWEVWTYLTHGFAHASYGTDLGIFHILGNMITLFFLGRPIEDRMGRSGFLWFYLCSIVVGGLVWLTFHLINSPEQAAFIVGASGAVSAVTVYFIFMAPHVKLLVFGILPVPAWGVGVFLLFSNLTHAFNPGSPVAWQAHLGGAAFGWLCFKLDWRFQKFEGLTKMFSGGPNLRVHNPQARSAAEEKIKAQADEILAKISEQGEESLTGKERRILKKYSNRLRKDRSV